MPARSLVVPAIQTRFVIRWGKTMKPLLVFAAGQLTKLFDPMVSIFAQILLISQLSLQITFYTDLFLWLALHLHSFVL